MRYFLPGEMIHRYSKEKSGYSMCGIESTVSNKFTHLWNYATCKRCLQHLKINIPRDPKRLKPLSLSMRDEKILNQVFCTLSQQGLSDSAIGRLFQISSQRIFERVERGLIQMNYDWRNRILSDRKAQSLIKMTDSLFQREGRNILKKYRNTK